jgi:hypothetical protein
VLRHVHPLLSARLAGAMHPLGAVVFLLAGAPLGALFAVLHGLVQPGDEVIVGDPMYATYEGLIAATGAASVAVPLRPEHGFRMQADDVAARITPRSRVLFGLQYSFGSGLSSLSRVKAAQAQAEGAQLSLDAAQEDVRASVRSDVEARDAAARLVDSLRANLLIQDQTFESYNRLFLAGKRSWFDVLNVVREVTENERALADAEVQYLLSDYRLQIQTGQLKW